MTSDTVTTVAAVSLGRSDKKKNEASLIELSPSPPPNRVTAHSRLVQNVSPRGICPIGDLNENDVLCGGGFVSNNYPGNKQFKDIIHSKQSQYLDPSTKKFEKAHIAAEIVTKIRARNPAGRFLKHDKDKRLWFDIGDAKAIKKTGQALREGAPNIRAPAYGNVSICNDASTVGDNSILVQNFPSQRRLQQLEQMNQSSNNAIPRIIASVSFFSKTETGEKIPHKFDKTVVDEFQDAIVDDDDGKKPAATQPRLPMSFIAANTDSTSKEKNTATITQITDGNGETMTDDGQGGHSTSNGMPLAPYGGDDVRYNSDGMPLFPGQEYRHRYLSFVAEDAAAVAATGANDDVQNITQV